MAEFKPMVKMYTTEPSVELKLKKGGSATFKMLHKEGAKHGFKPVKKMDGGAMGALAGSPALPMGNPAAARAMAAKRPMARPTPPARGIPAPGRPAMPPAMPPAPMGRPMMKKGGEVETPAMHKMEMKGIKGIGKELKKHEGMPASKAHKGLKTGGIAKSTKPGGYKTGGVVNGQGGFKDGGIIKSQSGNTKVVSASPDNNSAPTGDVKLGNGGGYKKGGAAKKHFATGGVVDTGRAVAMPKKPPSKPVAISELSGTFKKGGRVC